MGNLVFEETDSGRPAHRFCIKEFNLGIYEVTQAQWRRVMNLPN